MDSKKLLAFAMVCTALLCCSQPNAAETKFTNRVTIDQIEGSLKDYLEDLSRQSSVRTIAERPFDQRSLFVVNTEMPANDCRSNVARLFTLSWRTSVRPLQYTLYASSRDI